VRTNGSLDEIELTDSKKKTHSIENKEILTSELAALHQDRSGKGCR
jgi:hypothetical protein